MRVVQFVIPGVGRRVGFIDGDFVVDVTSSNPSLSSVFDVFDFEKHICALSIDNPLIPEEYSCIISTFRVIVLTFFGDRWESLG